MNAKSRPERRGGWQHKWIPTKEFPISKVAEE